MMVLRLILLAGCFLSLLLAFHETRAWGFWAHERIAWECIHRLPASPGGWYLRRSNAVLAACTAPDRRRYVKTSEAWNHYLDLDLICGVAPGTPCPDSALDSFLSHSWLRIGAEKDSQRMDSLGMLDRAVFYSYYALVKAWKSHDEVAIMRYSGDLLHYLSDLCVPLHTTSNYNGALQDWQGIHGFWESIIPEHSLNEVLFMEENAHEDSTGQPQPRLIWNRAMAELRRSHQATSNVFTAYAAALEQVEPWAQYGFVVRNGRAVSYPQIRFIEAFRAGLQPTVAQRMMAAIELCTLFLHEAWLEAGQPMLTGMGLNDAANRPKMPNFDPAYESIHPGH